MSKYVLGDHYPPIVWAVSMDFETWKATVIGGYKQTISDSMWQALYAEQWEPNELAETLLAEGWFNTRSKRKGYKKVVLTKEDCEKRIAQQVFNTGTRMLTRRLAPEARDYLNNLLQWARQTLQIDLDKL